MKTWKILQYAYLALLFFMLAITACNKQRPSQYDINYTVYLTFTNGETVTQNFLFTDVGVVEMYLHQGDLTCDLYTKKDGAGRRVVPYSGVRKFDIIKTDTVKIHKK